MVNENIKKAVKSLVGDNDNVAFMKNLQTAVFEKLQQNDQFRQYADDIEKYSSNNINEIEARKDKVEKVK